MDPVVRGERVGFGELDLSWMVGRRLIEVDFHEPGLWIFEIDGGLLSVECPWRALEGGRMWRSSEDHGHPYCLPAPVDSLADVRQLLRGQVVTAARAREGTLDLVLEFGPERVLEVLPISSGYEAWILADPLGRSFVAQGGGHLATWRGG